MPFFLFVHTWDRPYLVLGNWADEDMARCRVDVCFSQAQAKLVQKDLPEVATEIGQSYPYLPAEADEPAVSIRREVSSKIGVMICELLRRNLRCNVPGPTMTGLWSPSDGHSVYGGVIAWMEPQGVHHVAIVRSKEQARSIIDLWGQEIHVDEHIHARDDIATWPLPLKTKEPVQMIGGTAAQIISEASFYAVIEGRRKTRLN